MAKQHLRAGEASVRPPGTCPPELLTVDETARYLRISTKTLAKLITTGALQACRVGKQYRISRRALETYLVAGK